MGLVGWLLGFIILLIRVITHADFQVISPGSAGKSVAAAIAATGTSQKPLGHSITAQRALSLTGATHHRSCSTSDIADESANRYRQRTMSTGSGSNIRISKTSLPSTTSKNGGPQPIVINNHHHLHLHCHCSTTPGGRSISPAPSAGETQEISTPVVEMSVVNEVEPLLSSPSLPIPVSRGPKLEPS